MPLYRVERQMPTVGDEEIDAAAFRAVTCLALFPDVRWVRSYFDREAFHFTCYYEAPNTEDIRKHAQVARIPCDAIAEVAEFLPEMYQ